MPITTPRPNPPRPGPDPSTPLRPSIVPPPGPTALRAPQLNEGFDTLGNVAGNDPGIMGQLAQMFLKLREPLGTASLGLGGASIPPAARALNREAAYFTGLNQRPGGLLPGELETQQVRVGKDALMEALRQISALPKRTDIADAIAYARQTYPGGIAGRRDVPPPAAPPPTMAVPPTPPRSGQGGSRQHTVRGRPMDPRGATLTPEEMKAIMYEVKPR